MGKARIAYFITHAEVEIDPAIPVPDWRLSPRGRARPPAAPRGGRMPDEEDQEPDKFTELLAQLARVPKAEIDAAELEYQKARAREDLSGKGYK